MCIRDRKSVERYWQPWKKNKFPSVQQIRGCRCDQRKEAHWTVLHADKTSVHSYWQFKGIVKVYVKYASICTAHFYAKRLKCAQTWITQFYQQITPCLPLLPSRRTSPPFGWYSFYRPTEGRRLSRPLWLVTCRNKVPPPVVEPGHGHGSPIPVLTGLSVG